MKCSLFSLNPFLSYYSDGHTRAEGRTLISLCELALLSIYSYFLLLSILLYPPCIMTTTACVFCFSGLSSKESWPGREENGGTGGLF